MSFSARLLTEQENRDRRLVYGRWRAMKARCLNPKAQNYPRYGGAGVSIHPAWVNDFEAFFKAIGAPATPDMTLDRKDSSQGYVPGNVRWATVLEQNKNRRNVVLHVYRGEEYTVPELARMHGLHPSCLRRRLSEGTWTIEEALNTPSYGKAHAKARDGLFASPRGLAPRRAANRITTKLYEYLGRMLSIYQVSRECGISAKTLHRRMRKGFTLGEAANTPVSPAKLRASRAGNLAKKLTAGCDALTTKPPVGKKEPA